MRKNDPISHIMAKELQAVQIGQKLSDVYKIMCNTGIHHVPILKEKKLAGLVSFTDMMKLNLIINGADSHTLSAIIDQQFTIEGIMTSEVVTLDSNATVRAAAAELGKGGFHALPIIDANKNVVGIVTSTDLIRYLSEQY